MSRAYAVTFEKVSVSAVQDLIGIYGASGKMCRILAASVADVDTTAPTNTAMALRCRFLPATVTSGASGSAATPQKMDPGDAAASFTARVNDTVKATTSGTAAILEETGANVFAGWDYMFPRPPLVGPAEAFVFELITTPGAALTLSGRILVEEFGG